MFGVTIFLCGVGVGISLSFLAVVFGRLGIVPSEYIESESAKSSVPPLVVPPPEPQRRS